MSSQQHSQAGAGRRIANFNFLSGSGVSKAELREDTEPAPAGSSEPEARSFSLVDGNSGQEWLSIILKQIDDDTAQVAIEDLSHDETRLRTIDMGEVVQDVLYASNVRTATFDLEGSNIEPADLGPTAAGFRPTAEPGQYAIAA